MEILSVIITICMVIIAELFNTAVEFAVDAAADYYHPLAKIAKNVVLISEQLAVVILSYLLAFIMAQKRNFDSVFV